MPISKRADGSWAINWPQLFFAVLTPIVIVIAAYFEFSGRITANEERTLGNTARIAKLEEVAVEHLKALKSFEAKVDVQMQATKAYRDEMRSGMRTLMRQEQ